MTKRTAPDFLDFSQPERFVISVTPTDTLWHGYYVTPASPKNPLPFWVIPGNTGVVGDLTITSLYIVTAHLLDEKDREGIQREISAYLEDELKFAIHQAPVNFVKLRPGVEVVAGYAGPDSPGGLELVLRRAM